MSKNKLGEVLADTLCVGDEFFIYAKGVEISCKIIRAEGFNRRYMTFYNGNTFYGYIIGGTGVKVRIKPKGVEYGKTEGEPK